MSNLKNKIEAIDINIGDLLGGKKFHIDYFQREYRWQEKHIALLIDDLITAFLKSYSKEHTREEVESYQNYYLGPMVFSKDGGKQSIIDGQQRITSITLLLIYLNHLQKDEKAEEVSISDLIYSEKYGTKSFNMADKMRDPCLSALFKEGIYEKKENDNKTIDNMCERYADIERLFPEECSKTVLPYFIDWFIEKVVIVKITSYSNENAYLIFETMNDRGLNLTPTEMLKGYVLSKIDEKNRTEIDTIWKGEIRKLKNADINFFQAWFRGKYANSMRLSGEGTKDEDFELIGSQFHSWFKDKHKDILNLSTSDEVYGFFKFQFPFYVEWYLKIQQAQENHEEHLAHLNYIGHWGIAPSLQDAMLLASVNDNDDENLIYKKLDFTARYIETFTVRRAVNSRKFSQSSIKHKMFNLIKLIRDNNLDELVNHLTDEIQKMEEKWNGTYEFELNRQNKKFIKHLLSRISAYMDNLIGKSSNYESYHHPKGGNKPFEIEHIWGDKFNQHKDEFDNDADFQSWRDSIGALILLPNGTNQSFSNKKYEDKLDSYYGENTYAQTLHPNSYEKNPNFLNNSLIQQLNFQPHEKFKKKDIEERLALVERICEQLWSVNYFVDNKNP